jgi:vacuolar-type H+-ATPase subunit B/Vma2
MANNHTGTSPILVDYFEILAIVGDIVRVKVPEQKVDNGVSPRLEDLAVVEALDGGLSLAQVTNIKRDVVSLQVFRGTRGISTDSTVRFLGHPMQVETQFENWTNGIETLLPPLLHLIISQLFMSSCTVKVFV